MWSYNCKNVRFQSKLKRKSDCLTNTNISLQPNVVDLLIFQTMNWSNVLSWFYMKALDHQVAKIKGYENQSMWQLSMV